MSAAVATSLFWIAVAAALAPLIAGSVRRWPIPEIVLLLTFGIVIGPHALDLASVGSEIELLRELGLGMLFLLAGYEIDRNELAGRAGRRAAVTWLVSLALAFAVVVAFGAVGLINSEIAVAIALTSTALSALLPILKDRGLVDTPVGRAVLNHGAIGEIGPVIAMAVLLGTRSAVLSSVVLAAFAVVAVVVALLPARVREGSWMLTLVQRGSETTGQTTVRLVMLLLITLIAVAAVFNLDIILGAFAAGFILRRAVPRGNKQLETKLDGIGFGLLIPIFFITSGMAIDVSAVVSAPGILLAFLGLLLLVRGLPVFVASRYDRGPAGANLDAGEPLQVALYATTGLPLIVAVTDVAVSAGRMSNASASILVTAGAITVLVLPSLAGMLAAKTPGPPRDQLPA
ncbi:cation:proton antiporter [Rhodococcus xishaensis]|uniref:Cation:proton antiporter n=1 Tax=Rhodococcus xishaensis TaxID=2487364 RepID=A0A3S3ZPM5_9NOCA|nr:cation:proton antiporter [Rhodococcus xishaensis]RVW05395.1 cation:proton antiporter [Rhodococcus xishaensis]